MSIALYLVAALSVVSALFVISLIGKDRGVLTPRIAMYTTAINAACITIIVLAAVKLG